MFIKVDKNADGSHSFQVGGTIEAGWAYVPPDIVIPDTFPFVDIDTKLVYHPAVTTKIPENESESSTYVEKVLFPEYSQLEVVSMTEGEEILLEEPVIEPTPQDDTDAMLVDLEYRVTLLELFNDATA